MSTFTSGNILSDRSRLLDKRKDCGYNNISASCPEGPCGWGEQPWGPIFSGGKPLLEISVSFRKLVPEIPSTTHATFGLYRYPAKFIPQVIAYVLKNYAQSRSKVFDPFAGCGTVGVVARIYGCDYELWDLNPILEVVHAVAVQTPRELDIEALFRQMRGYSGEFVPRWSRLQYWYPEDFLPFLFKVWGFYHSLEDEYAKRLLSIPLLRVTRYFSYDDVQRQKLSQSPRSKQRIEVLLDSDWQAEFFRLLRVEVGKVIEVIPPKM